MKDRTRRQLAQALIEEIGASNPESLDTTVFRAVLEIRRLRKRAEEAEASGDSKLRELQAWVSSIIDTDNWTPSRSATLAKINSLLADPAPEMGVVVPGHPPGTDTVLLAAAEEIAPWCSAALTDAPNDSDFSRDGNAFLEAIAAEKAKGVDDTEERINSLCDIQTDLAAEVVDLKQHLEAMKITAEHWHSRADYWHGRAEKAEPSPFSRLTPRAAPPPDTTMRGEDIDDVDYNDPLQNYRRWFGVYGTTTLEKAIDELCRREVSEVGPDELG